MSKVEKSTQFCCLWDIELKIFEFYSVFLTVKNSCLDVGILNGET
jgi:hypothetical protein